MLYKLMVSLLKKRDKRKRKNEKNFFSKKDIEKHFHICYTKFSQKSERVRGKLFWRSKCDKSIGAKTKTYYQKKQSN